MTKTIRLLGAAAAAAVALSGCGGGGGVSDAGPRGPGGSGGPAGPARTVVYSQAAATAAVTAAGTTPSLAKSPDYSFIDPDPIKSFKPALRQNIYYFAVLQSSAASDAEAVQPVATLVVARGSDGPIGYVITHPESHPDSLYLNSTADSDVWSQASETHVAVGSGLSGVGLSAVSVNGQLSQAIVITDYDVTANDRDESAAADDPDTPIDETVDHAGDDTDYTVAGVWLVGTENEGNSRYELTGVGAFASGKVPYPANQYGSLGSVTYNGIAVGKRFADRKITDFASPAALTANFGASTVSGSVIDVGGGQVLKLGDAALDKTAVGGGPFSGTTQLADRGGINPVAGFTGKWGGAFFGPADTTNGPHTIAGTFGAASSDDSDSILGAFLAKR